ncbi:DUF6879 family protein [Streptomyces sp. URMC 126]|uniref:DUF6879 family protein n=1 Tax=Streptomyces sp. URMC 126 TaxID=3423401 RepID=UPI003F1E17B4
MPRTISLDAFGKLFEVFEHSAWRLETRTRYASDEATDTYAQFLKGEPPQWDLTTPWSVTIRKKTSRGARVGRVRVVDDPPTPGQRYLLAHAEKNIALGEDIRHLWRTDAEQRNLPTEDFWIFDSRLVALLNFDEADDLTDVELITEPAEVSRYSQVWERAWHYAIEHAVFTAELGATE